LNYHIPASTSKDNRLQQKIKTRLRFTKQPEPTGNLRHCEAPPCGQREKAKPLRGGMNCYDLNKKARPISPLIETWFYVNLAWR